jgi:hypothetical protein
MRKRKFMGRGPWLAIFLFYSMFSTCYAIEATVGTEAVESEPGGGLALHVWDRYVRRFRRDHNISLSLGYASAKWDVQAFGDNRGKNYRTEQNSVVAEYTFHILISGKTGYYLGTSGGYVFARPNKLDDEFQPSSSWLLPGVRAGMVYNYDPSGRLFAGVGAQLERFNNLKTHRASGEWQSASLTGESVQMVAGVDLFFALETAIHFAWTDTMTYFPKPAHASDFLVNARLTRRVQGAEMGLLYHFL